MAKPLPPRLAKEQAAKRATEDLRRSLIGDHTVLPRPPQRISEQNFLLRNLDLLASARAAVPVKKVVRMQTKEPGSLLSRLNLRPNVQELFKIMPYQVGALVPKIRLYKVFLDDTSTPGKIVELKFNDHTTPVSIEDITKTKYGRGDGVGIQSFTVETQGTNPAEGALVRCTLSIFFQNLEMLATPSAQHENDYLELILRRSQFEKEENSSAQLIPHARTINKDYFKLLAVVGWAVPEGSLSTLGAGLKEALESCTQTIFLSLYEHKIDFNQDGTAVLTAEYQGALEQMLSSDSYDILSLGKEHDLTSKLTTAQKELKAQRKKGQDINDSSAERSKEDQDVAAINKKIVSLKKQINELTAKARAEKYKRLIEKLYLSEKVGSIDVTPEQWEEIHKGGRGSLSKVVAPEDVNLNATDRQLAERKDLIEAKFGGDSRSASDKIVSWWENAWASKDTKSTRISFFYFGDLMELAAEILEDRRDEDKSTTPDIKILLGPVTFNVVDEATGTVTPKHVNLANVPISLKSFEFWFNKNVVKRKINTWPLRAFIKQAVSELILNALGENSKQNEGIRRSNQVGIQNLLIPGMGGDRKSHRIFGDAELGNFDLDSPAGGGLTVLNSFPIETPGQIGYNGFKHYLLIYGSTEILDVRNPADVEKDFKDGIYHFNIGADAGLVKSINFTKTDVPGLKASRLTSQDEEEGQLRDKYNASLELIGSSPLFTPGQKIYVNPTLAGMGTITSRNSIARQLGLGGYYDVIKVLSTIDKSGYRTSLECVWTSFGKEVAEGAKQAVQPAVASTADPEPAATSISTPVAPPTPSTKSSPKRATPTPKPKADVATATERVRRGTTDRDRRTRDLADAEAARQAAATQAAADAEAAPQAEHYYTEAEARAAAAGEES
jgi:hypothetical protein